MIRGFIDFALLDRSANLPEDMVGRQDAIVLPGLELNLAGQAVATHLRNGTLLVLRGQPRVRDVRLAQQIKHEGWACIADWLLAKPEDVLAKLAGRFSLLWLNIRSGQLGLASDRFNTHGFCYAQEGRRLNFAERADALPLQQRRIDLQGVFNYLYFHAIPAPDTVFQDVKRLAPGSFLVAAESGVRTSAWWSARFEEPRYGDLKLLTESFRTIVREAVTREAGDAKVGAFLSGGTDSSTVVGMLARSRQEPVRAYSIGFEAEGYDEMEYARIAAKHYGAEHRAYYITPDDLVAGIPGVAAHYDQPFGNSSALPAYYCARMAREDGLTRLLAGDGGDELFGGNTRYAKQRVFAFYQKVPALLRSGLLEPVFSQTWLHGLPLARKAASYIDQANTPLPDRTEQYNLLQRLGMQHIFAPDFLAAIDAEAPMRLQREVWQAVEADSLVNRMLGFDWRFTLADNDLPKVIGTTELAGMEVAFPLLDDDLLDFSASLPPEYKLKGQQLRWFFKEALRDFLPQQILVKKKHGFGLPFGPWMLKHDALGKLAREALMSLDARGILRPGFVRTLLEQQLPNHPGYYGEMVWILMMLEFWLQTHAPQFGTRSA